MARRFVSGFVVEKDATFNTNDIQLPLSLLCEITNTISTFPVAYCYIRSESTVAFVFINECLKELLFFDKCPGPSVMLRDFSAGLIQAMLKTMQQTRLEAGMEMTLRLENEVDDLETDCTLQLCCWHAAEAIKKRLIKEGYHVNKRLELADLIWKWIETPTFPELEKRRQALLDKLRPREQVC